MACGTPSLSSGVGGIPDVVKEHETGWILEEFSPQTIADRLICIFNNKDMIFVSKKAREFIIKEYSKSICLDNFQEFTSKINSVLRSKK